MVTVSQPRRPWVLAGGVTFAILELASLAYALLVGRFIFSHRMLVSAVMLTVMMTLLGMLVGLVFARFRRLFGSLDTYIQAVVTLLGFGALSGVITKGPAWFATVDSGVSSVMSAAAGLLFAFLGLRFGGNKQPQVRDENS